MAEPSGRRNEGGASALEGAMAGDQADGERPFAPWAGSVRSQLVAVNKRAATVALLRRRVQAGQRLTAAQQRVARQLGVNGAIGGGENARRSTSTTASEGAKLGSAGPASGLRAEPQSLVGPCRRSCQSQPRAAGRCPGQNIDPLERTGRCLNRPIGEKGSGPRRPGGGGSAGVSPAPPLQIVHTCQAAPASVTSKTIILAIIPRMRRTYNL
eukprot:SAG11_NODE_6523_length_1295_cov_5.966555_1_plen_212_part_00